MQLNLTFIAICLLSSLSMGNLTATEAEKDPYIKALGQEAKKKEIPIEADDKKANAEQAKKDADQDALTKKVINILEKSLGKKPTINTEDPTKKAENANSLKESNDLRQGLQAVVSDALNQGANIDDIRVAVETALLGIQKRKPNIKAEDIKSVDQILRNILASGSKLAEGDPGDAYIASLKGELENTTVIAKKKEEKKSEKNKSKEEAKSKEKTDNKTEKKSVNLTTEKSKERIAEAVTKSFKTQEKSADKYVSNLKEEAEVTMVTIQEGDTLSKISIRVYGNNKRYYDIFKANQDIISDKNHLLPGQVLKIPK